MLVRVPTENLQVLGNRRLDFCVTRQRPAGVDAESFCGFLFCQPIVTHAMIDDDARGFLRNNLSRSFGFACSFSAHGIRIESCFLRLVAFLAPDQYRRVR